MQAAGNGKKGINNRVFSIIQIKEGAKTKGDCLFAAGGPDLGFKGKWEEGETQKKRSCPCKSRRELVDS